MQDVKGPVFCTSHEAREKITLQSFEQHQSSLRNEYALIFHINFRQGPDDELTQQTLAFSESIVRKTKHPVHIMVFGVITGDGNIIPLFIFSYGLRLNTEAYIAWIMRLVAERIYIWQQDSAQTCCWKELHLTEGHCVMPHKLENLVLVVRKILRPHHS